MKLIFESVRVKDEVVHDMCFDFSDPAVRISLRALAETPGLLRCVMGYLNHYEENVGLVKDYSVPSPETGKHVKEAAELIQRAKKG